MAKIRVLNERLINKIAAGEVVERPASALKEMMENSLDAGATELRIDLENGGKQLIRIIDNGEGMDTDDMLLALERHATSKIRDFNDLEEVGTLGFRGEAIPSISAVSRLTMRSRTADQPGGNEVIVEGGVIREYKPVAMAPGTSIEVRQLFYNVPARRKFLYSPQTELAHCQNVITHYALAFPEVNFQIRHNGRELISAPPVDSTRNRIAALLGDSILQRLVPMESHDGEYGVAGFVSEPSFNRTNASMMYFFVNRRVVRDKILFHAIRSAFGDILPKGRSPIAFLFLTLPKRDVDVNVHPSKTEVRFRQASRVHDIVVSAIRSGLSLSKPMARATRHDPMPLKHGEPDTTPADRHVPQKPATPEEGPQLHDLGKVLRERIRIERLDFSEPGAEVTISEPIEVVKNRRGQTSFLKFADPAMDAKAGSDPSSLGANIDPDRIIPLGQVRQSYIVAIYDDGLLLIDQHAAHERILFEQLQKEALRSTMSQGLLHPVIVDLPPLQARLVEEKALHLEALGFDVEPFGPGSVALRALPASIDTERAREIFVNIAADIQRLGRKSDTAELARELVVSASCHGAIKVNTPLNREKMRWLIDNLFQCEIPMRCPHGRPVVLTISESELRQRFGRS